MIHNIQILRAFAAINVVIFHMIGTSAYYGFELQSLRFLDGWGSNGVDIFFVISGFLMLHIQLTNYRDARTFLISRIIRIAPLYWILTTLFTLLILFLPHNIFNGEPITYKHFFESIFFISHLFSDLHPVVYVGWSLEWEMLFYLIFSIALIFNRWRNRLTIISTLVLFFSIYLENFIAVEFLIGMSIAIIYSLKKDIPQSIGLLVLIFGFLLLFMSINNQELLRMNRLITSGIPAGFIVLGVLYSYPVKNYLLTLMGDSSYSLYLVQAFSIPFSYKVAAKFFQDLNPGLIFLICLLLSLGASIVLYLIVEKKITRKLKVIFIK